MKSQDKRTKQQKIISKFPDTPGVYKFLRKNKIIYIGKATSLRDRVRSYFNQDIISTRGLLITKMLERFDKVEYIKTDSVLEALILEAHLIKKYQPEANTIDKDDKSFNYVVITKENFPRVLIVREKELNQSAMIYRSKLKRVKDKNIYDISYTFGPLTNEGQLKEALKLVRKIFPFRDKCNVFIPTCQVGMGRPCFNRQIGLCPGVCTGEISKQEYAKIIRNIILFFHGNKKQIAKNLEKQMKAFSNSQEFEKSNIAKEKLFSLRHIQDVALIKDDIIQGLTLHDGFRIESYDVAHMSGKDMVGVMTVIENGEIKKGDYRKFSARGGSAFGGKTVLGNNCANDIAALSEVLERRLAHIEWRLPDLIVVDGGMAQKSVMEKIINKNNLKIPVVSVVKDDRHKAREILGDKKWLKYEKEILLSNSEAHRFAIKYHKKLREKFFI